MSRIHVPVPPARLFDVWANLLNPMLGKIARPEAAVGRRTKQNLIGRRQQAKWVAL
jgi:hypothetical protein